MATLSWGYTCVCCLIISIRLEVTSAHAPRNVPRGDMFHTELVSYCYHIALDLFFLLCPKGLGPEVTHSQSGQLHCPQGSGRGCFQSLQSRHQTGLGGLSGSRGRSLSNPTWLEPKVSLSAPPMLHKRSTFSG